MADPRDDVDKSKKLGKTTEEIAATEKETAAILKKVEALEELENK